MEKILLQNLKIYDGDKEIAVLKEPSLSSLLCAAPLLLDACEGVLNVLGDDELPDNGEFSGAAVTDLVACAVEQAKS